MTWQLDTELDVYLRWITGNGHGARTRGDDRWSLSLPDPRRSCGEPDPLFIGTGREGVRLLDVAEIASASGY
jgi:hypothetical protein